MHTAEALELGKVLEAGGNKDLLAAGVVDGVGTRRKTGTGSGDINLIERRCPCGDAEELVNVERWRLRGGVMSGDSALSNCSSRRTCVTLFFFI